MHFPFSVIQTIWTLTFAALLVLLVVLLGRGRSSRFPWFTASIILLILRMLVSRLLFNKVAPLISSEIFLTLAVLGSIISLLVVVEMARRAFAGASRKAWIIWTLILVAIGGAVLVLWGPWPSAETVFARSTLADLRLMQLVTQKGDLLADLLIVELCILMAFAGSRYGAGWRSHVQRITVGLSTASISQIAVRAIWQVVASTAAPKTREEYTRVMGLQEKLFNANSVISLLAIVWWIVCLWIDEPGSKRIDAEPSEALPADTTNESTAEIPHAASDREHGTTI